MSFRNSLLATLLAFSTISTTAAVVPTAAYAEDRGTLDVDSSQALRSLLESNPAAFALAKKARAVLIFPKVVKAGLVFGGAYGEGELRKGDKVMGYYNSVTGSWGFQAGAQTYGYVVFLMTKKAEKYIYSSKGWEIGVGPTVVVVNDGMAENFSTSTQKGDAYAFIFDQQGLMAGVSIEGTKISKIKAD